MESVLGWGAADEEGDSSDSVTGGYFVLHRTGGDMTATLTVSVSYDGDSPFADEGFDFVGDQAVLPVQDRKTFDIEPACEKEAVPPRK